MRSLRPVVRYLAACVAAAALGAAWAAAVVMFLLWKGWAQ